MSLTLFYEVSARFEYFYIISPDSVVIYTVRSNDVKILKSR